MRDFSHRARLSTAFRGSSTIFRGFPRLSVLAAYDFFGRRNPYFCMR